MENKTESCAGVGVGAAMCSDKCEPELGSMLLCVSLCLIGKTFGPHFVTAGVVYTVFTFIFGFHRVSLCPVTATGNAFYARCVCVTVGSLQFSKAIIKILFNRPLSCIWFPLWSATGIIFIRDLSLESTVTAVVYDIFCLCWIKTHFFRASAGNFEGEIVWNGDVEDDEPAMWSDSVC